MKDYYRIPINFQVYIIKIKNKPIYKVGVSNKLKARLRNLKVSIYEEFDILYVFPHNTRQEARSHEQKIKLCNAIYRIRGEWYSNLLLNQ